MKTIDLTTPASALAYLRSLDQSSTVSLPGHHTETTVAGDAVRAITGEDAHRWAKNRWAWEWTVADLIATLTPG